jgi:hypothetical protein
LNDHVYMCVRDIDFNFVSAIFQFHFAYYVLIVIFFILHFLLSEIFFFLSQKLDYFDLFGLFIYICYLEATPLQRGRQPPG